MVLKKNCKSRKSYIWIPIILFVKLIVLYFFFLQIQNQSPDKLNGIVFISNDFRELIEPSNQLIKNGIYSLDDKSPPYAGRFPGYAFPYLVFRLLFSENISLQLLILAQIVFSSIAIFLLGLISEKISKKSLSFIISIIVFSFFPFFIKEDLYTMSTSFSISAFVIHLFFLEKFLNNKSKKILLFSGLFLTWVVLLRPFTLLYVFPILIYITYKNRKKLNDILRYNFIFLLPFIIFECFWIPRNYFNTKEIIPLQDAYVPGQEYGYTYGCDIDCIAKFSVVEIRKLISSWGGNSIWYKPGSEMHWFLSYKPLDFKNHLFVKNNIFFDGFNKDSLINLKKDLQFSYNKELSYNERVKIDLEIVQKCKKFKAIYMKNKPLNYFFISHLNRIKNFLFVNPTQDWPGASFTKNSIYYKLYKSISILIYLLTLLFIPIYGVIHLKNKNMFGLICFSYACILIFIFGFLVELSSVLYFSTGLICGWICLVLTFENFLFKPK